MYSTLVNLAFIIRPAIAGVVIAAVGLAPCFLINGVSFVAVVIMLGMMRTNELLTTPPVSHAKGQLQEGFKYVVSTPIQLLLAWQQHLATDQLAANARPGHVFLVGGFSGLYYHRWAHRRLVCRSSRGAGVWHWAVWPP